MAKNHGPSVKDDEQYERLREEGASKEKAARIANTGRKKAARRGGSAAAYEEWTVEELRGRALELDIAGRSKMNKQDLIKALRGSR